MIVLLYAIRDTASEGFTRPFAFSTRELADRSFIAACAGGDKDMTENPDQFTLYKIGMFDDQSGIIEPEDPIRQMTGLEAVAAATARAEKLQSLNKQIAHLNGEGYAE